jgi:hypothetical protein
MHDVLHYDGGETVKIAPSLRHRIYLKTCAVDLYRNSKTTSISRKSEIQPSTRVSVPCPAAAVATSNYSLDLKFEITFF